MISEISRAIDLATEQLFEQFRRDPFKFYTESDLVCEFYRLFLSNYPDLMVLDASGRSHSIIHTEYPTPFRCDMSNHGFIVKDDEDTTGRGTRYKRGHLDLIILNPQLIKDLTAEELMMQDYQRTRDRVLQGIGPGRPMVLHAIEFQYYRGVLTEEGAKRFADIILQDHKKLAACCHPENGQRVEGFVERYESLVFFQKAKSADLVAKEIRGNDGIKLCSP